MRTLTMLGVMIVARVALAAPATSADALIERGIELRAKGKPAEALELFRQANAHASSARGTAQEGLAEVSLHQWLAAHEHLRAALARHDSEWIENLKTRQALEKTLSDVDSHLTRVRVQGTNGAEVSVDGKAIGRIPLAEPAFVDAGTIKIGATAPGRAGVAKEIVGAAGEEVVANLELDPLSMEAAAPPPVPAVSFVATPETPRWRKRTGISLVGAGAAAVVAGIVWIDLNGKGTGTCASNGVCTKTYDTGLQGWIAIGAGAAMGAAGTGLMIWTGRRQEVGVAVGPGSAMISGNF